MWRFKTKKEFIKEYGKDDNNWTKEGWDATTPKEGMRLLYGKRVSNRAIFELSAGDPQEYFRNYIQKRFSIRKYYTYCMEMLTKD